MQRAQQRDAAGINQFYFRRNVFPLGNAQSPYDLASRPVSPGLSRPVTPSNGMTSRYASSSPRPESRERRESLCSEHSNEDETGDDAIEMTLNEVINGKGETFPGLMGVVNAYLNSLNVDMATKCELRRYLDLIKYRAKGES